MGKLRTRSVASQITALQVPPALRPLGSRFHDLRHYYASLFIRHSESVKIVQKRLGHASASETLDVYSHLWPDSDDRTRHAIETELGSAVSDLRHEAASGA